MAALIKTPQQIALIRRSCEYLNELMSLLYQHCSPGMRLIDIEQLMKDFLAKYHLLSAFKGYEGFPGELCLSLNDCIVHGIPDRTLLKDGDLLKVDVGINYRGAISDSAFSIIIGGPDKNPTGQTLIDVTKSSLEKGLGTLGPGKTLVNYGQVVADYVTSQGFSVIKGLTGHGVGLQLHEDPSIFNYPHPSARKTTLKPGMIIALEPILAECSDDFIEDEVNGWNLYTDQGDLATQREYTVLITDNGAEVLAGLREL